MKSRAGSLLFVVVCVALAPVSASAQTPLTTNTWGDQITDPGRFELLAGYGGTAVVDHETGLVWEQSPSPGRDFNWFGAVFHCDNLTVGNRKGWRLPTVHELASLVDPTQADPTLPPNHPFSNIANSFYWSSTTSITDASAGAGVQFNNGLVFGINKNSLQFAWCVRAAPTTDVTQ